MNLFGRKPKGPAPLKVDDGYSHLCKALLDASADSAPDRSEYALDDGSFRRDAAETLASELATSTRAVSPSLQSGRYVDEAVLNFAASKLTDEDWVFNQERLNLEASYRYSGERPTEEQLAKEHERLRALAKEVAEKATSTSPREALATTGSRSLAMSAVSSGEQALQTGEIPATGKMGATVTTGDLYGPGRQSSTPRLGHMLSPTESLAVALVMFARSAERDPRGLDQYSIGSVTDMVPDVATALKAYQAAKEVYPATLDEASKAALSEARQSVEVNSEAALESLVTAVSNHDALRDGHQEALRSVDTEISTLRQQDTASKQLDGAMKAASELEQAHAGPKVNIRRPHVTTPDYPAH